MPQKPCTAFLIDPFALIINDRSLSLSSEPPMREVAHDGTIQDIYRRLSTPDRRVNMFEACYINGSAYDDCMYVDEEGLLHAATHFLRVEGFPNPVAGKGYVLGTDEEGNSISPGTPFGDLWRRTSIAVGNIEVCLSDVPVGQAIPTSAVRVHKHQVVRAWAQASGV